VKASSGLKDFEQIDRRFDELIRAPLQKQIEFDFKDDPASFREKMQVPEPPVLELVIYGITPDGPAMVQSVITANFVGGRAKIGKIYHHVCKNGFGNCFLLLGVQDEIVKDAEKHPVTGDLPADAERFVNVEANARPHEVGGLIRVVLIDKNGVDKKNPQDSCPETR
jgi:hypothetical protein